MSLRSLAFLLKLSQSGLRAPERPLLTPSLLILIQVMRWGRKGYEFARQGWADYTVICRSVGDEPTAHFGHFEPFNTRVPVFVRDHFCGIL